MVSLPSPHLRIQIEACELWLFYYPIHCEILTCLKHLLQKTMQIINTHSVYTVGKRMWQYYSPRPDVSGTAYHIPSSGLNVWHAYLLQSFPQKTICAPQGKQASHYPTKGRELPTPPIQISHP